MIQDIILDLSGMFVLDSHCDTPSQILRLRDLSVDNHHSHVDFPKLKRGGVDGAFFALYVPGSMNTEEAFAHACVLLDGVEKSVAENKCKAAFAYSVSDALRNKSEGLFSVFLGLENGSPIGDDLNRLKYFYDRGVRYITLCHSSDNQICDSCASKVKRWGGLSPFGKELIFEMNRLGIHFAKGGNLFAGDGVVAGKGIGSIGEGHCCAFAKGSDGVINGGDGTCVVVLTAAEYSVKKCHGFSSNIKFHHGPEFL